jgi:ankyrin repeat protein
MDKASFIKLVTEGDGHAALAELQRDPTLAAARDSQNVSVICLAVYHGRLGLAAALAERRTDLDIFEASCIGHTARVRQILSEDPNGANAISPDGFSPLGYSAFFDHAETLRELLDRDGDVNVPSRNSMGVYPINSAVAHSDQGKAVALVGALLASGANPNSQQHGGFTALHEAALNGNVTMIRLLLKHGADSTMRNDEGASALDLARSKGHVEAARVLVEEAV